MGRQQSAAVIVQQVGIMAVCANQRAVGVQIRIVNPVFQVAQLEAGLQ